MNPFYCCVCAGPIVFNDSSHCKMKPKYKRLEEIRDKLSDLRGDIAALRLEDELWNDCLSPLEGGLTCVIATAYDSMKEMKKHYEKWGEK